MRLRKETEVHLTWTIVPGFSRLVGSWDGLIWGNRNLLRTLPRRFHPEICCGKLPRCTIHHSGWSGHRHCTTSHPYGSGRNYLAESDTTSINTMTLMDRWKGCNYTYSNTRNQRALGTQLALPLPENASLSRSSVVNCFPLWLLKESPALPW